jgi:6-phosphogluconate dehydrogenase (decarboxylating)
VIEEILPHLDPGDVRVDGGNANLRDTQRQHASAADHGVHVLSGSPAARRAR